MLLMPLLALALSINFETQIDVNELIWAIKNSTLQAALSAVFSIGIGILGSFGLVWFEQKFSRKANSFLEFIVLLPNFVPSLYVMIACFQLFVIGGRIYSSIQFPFGAVGVVFIHTAMNTGVAAVLISKIWLRKMSQYSEVAIVMGVKKATFLYRVALPMCFKELTQVGFLIFVMCFSSFTIPLIMGGGKLVTIEMLIYEKIRTSLNFNEAGILSMIQVAFIFLVSLFKNEIQLNKISKQSTHQNEMLSIGVLITIPLLISIMLASSYTYSAIESMVALKQLNVSEVIVQSFGTLGVSILVGCSVIVFYLATAYFWPDNFLNSFLYGFSQPGTAIVGFGLILMRNSNLIKCDMVYLTLGLWMLFFPMIMRWSGLQELNGLSAQLTMARIMGADRKLIFKMITRPQIMKTTFWLAGIASFWSAGEFALSRIILNSNKTLAMSASQAMSGYHMSEGTLLSLMSLSIGSLVLMLFIGVEYVISRKYQTP